MTCKFVVHCKCLTLSEHSSENLMICKWHDVHKHDEGIPGQIEENRDKKV